MDHHHLDALAKTLARATPRRTVLGLLGATIAGGLLVREPAETQAKVFTCAGGAHPCKSGNVTACCLPGEYCCQRKPDDPLNPPNPICTASKKDCPA